MLFVAGRDQRADRIAHLPPRGAAVAVHREGLRDGDQTVAEPSEDAPRNDEHDRSAARASVARTRDRPSARQFVGRIRTEHDPITPTVTVQVYASTESSSDHATARAVPRARCLDRQP